MRLWTGFAAGVATAATLVLASTTGSHATAVTIGSYYEEGSDRESTNVPNSGECTGSGCTWIFNVVPAGKQLIVTNVSCRISVSPQVTADSMVEITLASHANGTLSDRRHRFKPPTPYNQSGNYQFVFNESTTALFRAGDRPVIYANATMTMGTVNWSANCTISGRIGNPPPP